MFFYFVCSVIIDKHQKYNYKSSQMDRVQLGTSDLQVSPICVGCWQFNGNQADETWPAQPEHVSIIKDLNQ